MNELIIFAPCVLFVITVLIQLNIFARTSELKAIEAKLMTYAMEHFVTQNTYNLNYQTLQRDFNQLRQDISDMRNLLIQLSANLQREPK